MKLSTAILFFAVAGIAAGEPNRSQTETDRLRTQLKNATEMRRKDLNESIATLQKQISKAKAGCGKNCLPAASYEDVEGMLGASLQLDAKGRVRFQSPESKRETIKVMAARLDEFRSELAGLAKSLHIPTLDPTALQTGMIGRLPSSKQTSIDESCEVGGSDEEIGSESPGTFNPALAGGIGAGSVKSCCFQWRFSYQGMDDAKTATIVASRHPLRWCEEHPSSSSVKRAYDSRPLYISGVDTDSMHTSKEPSLSEIFEVIGKRDGRAGEGFELAAVKFSDRDLKP